MRGLLAVWRRLRGVCRRARFESDLETELDSHLQFHTEDNLRSGMTPDEARREALLRLGSIAAAKEQVRAQHGFPVFEGFARDCRFGLRTIGRNRLFSFVTVALLTLGLSASYLVFSALNVIVLRPLPFKSAGQLVQFGVSILDNPGPGPSYDWGFPAYLKLRGHVQSLTSVFAASEVGAPLDDPEASGMVSVALTTGNYFSELGVGAKYGRTLTDQDDNEALAGTMPAILSYRFWQDRFNSDKRVLGRALRLQGYPFLIAGVLPQDFSGMHVDRSPDVWVPSRAIRLFPANQEAPQFEIYGRLSPGTSLDAAQAESFHVLNLAAGWSAEERAHFQFLLVPVVKGTSLLRKQFSQPLSVLLLAAGTLLLLISSNIAGLLSARSAGRKKEMALRLAIGASRWRISRQVFMETALLVVGGMAGAGIVTLTAIPRLEHAIPPVWTVNVREFPIVLHLQPDWRVVAFEVGTCGIVMLLTGLAPAWAVARVDLNACLKSADAAGKRLRNSFLIGVQVALCTVVLLTAALVVRTFLNLRHVSLGFNPSGITTFSLDFRSTPYTKDQTIRLEKNLLSASVPGLMSP